MFELIGQHATDFFNPFQQIYWLHLLEYFKTLFDVY